MSLLPVLASIMAMQAARRQGRKGGEGNTPAVGPGHFWMSRSSKCGRGAGVQASLESLRGWVYV